PQWLSHIAAQVGEGITVTDLKGKIIFVNRAWARMHGYRERELVGKNLKVGHTAKQLREEVVPFNKKVMKLGRWTGEVGHVRKNGTEFITEMTATVFRDSKKKPIGIIGFARDITDQKRAELALRESEVRYRTFLESTSDLVFLKDNDFRYIIVNKPYLDFFNKKAEDVLGKTDFELMIKGIAKGCRASDIASLKEGKLVVTEEQAGDRIYETRKFPVMLDGNKTGVGGYIRDLTECKRSEEMLNQSEEKYRTLVDNIQDGVFIIQGVEMQFVNEAFARMVGYTAEEVIGMDFRRLVAPEDLEMVADRYRRRQAGENVPREYEFRARHKDGKTRVFVNMNVGLVDYQGRVASMGTVKDITGRKRNERALMESEERYRVVIEQTGQIIYDYDIGSGRIRWSGAIERVTGFAPDEFQAVDINRWESMIHPEDRAEALRQLDEAIRSCGNYSVEYRFQRRAGAYIHISDHGVVLSDDQGRAGRMLGTMADVTKRKQAENRFRESEEKYRQFFEGVAEGIYRTTPEGRIILANKSLVRILGYDDIDELMALDLSRQGYQNPSARERFQADIERAGSVTGYETVWRRKNGASVILSENARVVRDATGKTIYYEGTIEDITERTKAQLALMDEKNKLAQLFKVSLAIAWAPDVQQQADLTIRGLADLQMFNRMALAIKDGQGRTTHLAQFGFTDDEAGRIRSAPPTTGEGMARLLQERFRISQSYIIPYKAAEVRDHFLVRIEHPGQRPAEDWHPNDSLIIPLTVKGRTIGFILADEPRDGRIPGLEAIHLLEIYANQAAIAVDNLRLYHHLERSYYDTLAAFVSAMDAKDPYTKGHSENVRRYALKLARHMGLPEDRIRLIDYSSLLHDIGKLGVKEHILSKASLLSDAEYSEVKLHPVIGSQMVSAIENLSLTAPIIHSHHEYYDGCGYPGGKKGDQIPLESRIISVADAFEAMTSDRPYRKAYGCQEALRRLEQASGTQFDREIVSAFVEMTMRENEAHAHQ
ncbi:MAG: PAS domain S-box protein, partial [Candidatus Edwardsbacteria bacterium]|nr:PAS domain S-box protein [Candidatus Edwardsbacteria bacterium]